MRVRPIGSRSRVLNRGIWSRRVWNRRAALAFAIALLISGCQSGPSLEERIAASRALTPQDPGFFAVPHGAPREKPSDRFPNTELIGTDGQRYRFYEDLVRDQIVVIQFMYTTCTGI